MGVAQARFCLEGGNVTGRRSPSRAAVLICGLQGTIGRTIERLVPRGFIPDHRRIRKALEIGDARPSSIWWEQYDTTPVIDVDDATAMGTLRDQLRAAEGQDRRI